MANRPMKKDSRPAIYARLDPKEQAAFLQWVALNAVEKSEICKMGMFALMSMPRSERQAWAKRYNDWKDKGFPTAKLDGMKG